MVPQLALRPIADNGVVLHASAAMGFSEEIIDIENGINKSGTFNYICRNCDSSFFQDYENEENLINEPTDKMMAEIAVKNMLLFMSKRATEREMIKIQQKKYKCYKNIEEALKVQDLDLNEFEEEVFFHKGILDRNEEGGYQILYWKVLPYIIPIAGQAALALPWDMEGRVINQVYNLSGNVRMQYMHVCVFPLKTQSVILSFYHKRDKLYRNLRHQINTSSENKVLAYFNSLLFAHSENYFISKTIQNEIESNDELQRLSQEVNGCPELGFLNIENFFGTKYAPINIEDIPNFLDSRWAI